MKIELGKKHDDTILQASPEKMDKPYYPCFYVNGLEHEGDIKMGQELTAKVRVKGVNMHDHGDGKKVGYDFEVISIEDGKSEEKKSSPKHSSEKDMNAIDKGLDEIEKEHNKKEEESEY